MAASPSCHRQGPARSARGFTLVELLVGLVIGALVLAGLMTMSLQQGRQARQADAELRGLRELEAIDRLLHRLLRQAVAPEGEARRFEVSPDGASLAFRARLDDGSERPLAFRLAQGTLEMRIDAGAWQALHDAGAVTLTSARFEVSGDGAGRTGQAAAGDVPGCAPPHPPVVRWRFEARAPVAGGPGLALPVADRRVQVRDRASMPGCRP